MATIAEKCSHCGKKRAGLQRCSQCKQASYCGAACQNAGWKRHKRTCVSLYDVAGKLNDALVAGDWRGVLTWEGRMEELMARQSDAQCAQVLHTFAFANQMGLQATGTDDHALSFVGLAQRHIPLLGKLQRFRDQGEAMYGLGNFLCFLKRNPEAEIWYLKAREVGAAHGFFSVESKACEGLGRLATDAGRQEEGLELLRNALAAAQLSEVDEEKYEMRALEVLIYALFKSHAIDEVEECVGRYREAAKVVSDSKGGFCLEELNFLFYSARLHEARGRPQESAGDLLALLNLMRENEEAVQSLSLPIRELLKHAILHLKILDSDAGEEELRKLVAAELSKVRHVLGTGAERPGPYPAISPS